MLSGVGGSQGFDLYVGAQAGQAVASYLDFSVDDDAVAADVAAQEGGNRVTEIVFPAGGTVTLTDRVG
ncbi:hypothetical protein [Streptomyces sp. NPDC096311]|uniref:hypothetical protein n=1 Tax=Streptomyces sp. NPDC096311 TaxID=3366083 RepID=UPI00380A18D6